MNLILKPKKVLIFLMSITIVLCIIHIVFQFSKFYLGHSFSRDFVRLFDLNAEANIPTLFSSLLLLFSSLLLSIISFFKKRDNGSYTLHWSGLAVIFFFLFIDEAVSLHEILIDPIRTLLSTSGLFYYAWIIPYGILILILAIGYFKFILHLPSSSRFLFIMAGSIYTMGAMGFEMIGGHHDELFSQFTKTYALWVLFEETLEMIGIVIFIYSLLLYLTSEYTHPRTGIEFSNNRQHPPKI